MMKRLLLCLLIITLAACGDNATLQTPATEEPVVGPPPRRTAAPTLEPIAYREPKAVITRDNVAQIAQLGRLDAPGQIISTVFNLSLSPDGTRMAALNNDLLLGWDLLTGSVTFTTARQNAAWVYYSSDKTELYTLDVNGGVVIYDAERGISQNGFAGHAQFGGPNAFYQDTGWLALSGLDGTVKVWDTYERTSLVTIEAHTDRITAIAFSNSGDLLATAGLDGVIKIWNWRERALIATMDQGADEIPVRLVFSPDDARVATAANITVQLWSAADGQRQHILDVGENGASDVLLFSPDGQYLLTGGIARNLRLWNVQTGEGVNQLPDTTGNRVSASFSPDGTMLITSSLDGSVFLWDMTQITGETLGRANIEFGPTQVLTTHWSQDGFTILLVDSQGPIYVWGIGE